MTINLNRTHEQSPNIFVYNQQTILVITVNFERVKNFLIWYGSQVSSLTCVYNL